MEQSSPPTPEDWIDVARGYSRAVCRNNPGWDRGDLEGSILLDCVRWPPKDRNALRSRCRGSANDWFRTKLGRNSPTTFKFEMLDPATVTEDGDRMSVLDSIPFEVDFEDEIQERQLRDALPLIMRGRDATIARMLLDGYTLVEIADLIGVTESRVSQLAGKGSRIERSIKRFMALPRAS